MLIELQQMCCFAFSNILAGSNEQIQDVIDCGAFDKLIELVLGDNFKVKREAAYAIRNAVLTADDATLMYDTLLLFYRKLLEKGILAPICEMLSSTDNSLVMDCLLMLQRSFEVGVATYGEIDNPLAEAIEELGGVESIDTFANERHGEIGELASKICKQYIDAVDDELMQ